MELKAFVQIAGAPWFLTLVNYYFLIRAAKVQTGVGNPFTIYIVLHLAVEVVVHPHWPRLIALAPHLGLGFSLYEGATDRPTNQLLGALIPNIGRDPPLPEHPRGGA